MLKATGVHKAYRGNRYALKGVDVEIGAGQMVGLIGESGCGKSTLAHILCLLEQANSGTLTLDGVEYRNDIKAARQRIQIIFQDSAGSLDPRSTIFNSIKEPLDNFSMLTKAQKKEYVYQLLSAVELDAIHAKKYPHQLSGGERQRVVIARAIALLPDYLICDEPVSSLDAGVTEQILKLLKDLQVKHSMGCLFISHDIALTLQTCHRVYVMQDGKIVDQFEPGQIKTTNLHAYTQMLLSIAGEDFSC